MTHVYIKQQVYHYYYLPYNKLHKHTYMATMCTQGQRTIRIQPELRSTDRTAVELIWLMREMHPGLRSTGRTALGMGWSL